MFVRVEFKICLLKVFSGKEDYLVFYKGMIFLHSNIKRFFNCIPILLQEFTHLKISLAKWMASSTVEPVGFLKNILPI